MRIKPRGKYQAVSIPTAMHDEIVEYIKNSSFNSIADFMKYIIREKIKKLDEKNDCSDKFKFCPYCGKPLT